MEYRIIYAYVVSGEIIVRYYADLDAMDDDLFFVDRAIENDCRMGYVIQRHLNQKIFLIDSQNGGVGEWENLSWEG